MKKMFAGVLIAGAMVLLMAQQFYQTSTVRNVAGFAGATNGDKIAACIASLPTSGGVCDARSLPSGGTIPAMTLSRSGWTVLGPCGSNTVTGTILITANPTQIHGVHWQGCNGNYGHVGTEFVWGGNATDPLLQIAGVRDSEFSHFSIVANAPQAALFVGIGLQAVTGPLSTNNSYHDIIIEGVVQGSLKVGMRWFGPGGNNDFTEVRRVQVTNYDVAAWSIEGSQAKAELFVNSACVGLAIPNEYCVTTAYSNALTATVATGGISYPNGPVDLTLSGLNCIQNPIFTATASGGAISNPVLKLPGMCLGPGTTGIGTTSVGGGSGATLNVAWAFSGDFTAINMGIARNGGADFFLGAPDDTITIVGGNSESSARLLLTSAASSAGWPVVIMGMRWSPDQIAPDQKAIVWNMKGGLTLINNIIGSANVGSYPVMSLEPSSAGTQAVAIGNVVSWDVATAGANPFVGPQGQWRLMGNTLQGHPTGGTIAIPDAPAGARSLHKTTNTVINGAVVTAGSSCSNGPVTLTVAGGTGTAAQFSGTATAGAISALTAAPTVPGAYTVDPVNPVAVTGGSCSGVTLTLNYDAPLVPLCNAGNISYDGIELWAADATAPTYRGAYVGGGAVKNPILCVVPTGWVTK